MRIPNRILEHPIEAMIAGLLLLALLFVSGDPQGAAPANRAVHLPAGAQIADSQKM